MSLIRYEFRKLISYTYVRAAFALLIVITAVLCAFECSRETVELRDDTITALELYGENRDFYDKYANELKALNDEYIKVEISEIKKGNFDYKSPDLPTTLFRNQRFNDFTLLNAVKKQYSYAEGYGDRISEIIKKAEKQLESAESASVRNDFNIRYQKDVISVYSRVGKIRFAPAVVKGYDTYFSFTATDYILLLLMALAAPSLFLGEYSSGAASVIRATKNGRWKTVVSKTAAMLIFDVTAVFVFSGAVACVVGFYKGFSPLSCPVQAVELFANCPFLISCGQLVALSLAIKLLVMFSFSMLTALFALLFRSFKLSFIASAVFGGVNYALYSVNYIDSHNPFGLFNIFAMADATSLFSRFSVGNVFGIYAERVVAGCLIYALIAVVSFAICGRRFAASAPFVVKPIGLKLKLPSVTLPAKTLFGYEFKKISGNALSVIAMLLLVAVKLITSAQSYAAQPSFYDSIMKYYMTTLEGEWNEEKSAYISEIRNEINSKIAGWKAIEEKYRAHEITYDEYIQCRTEYEDAKAKNEPFREVEKRDLYLRERSESGLKAEFVYDTGYNKLFFSPFDIILLVLLAALLSGVFADEYSSGFIHILRSTPNGRQAVFGAKLAASLSICLLYFIAFSIIDFVNLQNNFLLPSASYCLACMPRFERIGEMSIGAFAVLYLLLRLIAFAVVVLLISALSELCKKTLPCLCVVSAVMLLPYAFKSVVSSTFEKFDMTTLLAPAELMAKSDGIITYAITLIAFSAVSLVLLAASAINYNKSKGKN